MLVLMIMNKFRVYNPKHRVIGLALSFLVILY